ncbi:MAG: 3-phosphoglycerate dehydrogenase family protein [Eubacteriales bacterium]|jgi:D-3-phosphoglycerate dehydrogenase|nr:3-phosphoglycerate dehydrogenase family protein [Eubacteriales bacterium]MDD4104223.1 3-phosphoglycerate dehydrogenase family protein [Eubacteriales bacterium]MDD4709928.1 3-phosphoglycerate dehydrogenase family protein [Eubacteriales bacterium]
MLKERNVACLNDISSRGLEAFGANYTITKDPADSDCWLVRSANLLQKELPPRLRAIARAGAGVNNIPLDRCTQAGVVVFNTPGANANAVAELVVAGMLLASRDILGGANWVRSQQAGPQLPEQVEKGKKAFAGTELRGKRLGVIGLGAVGHLVANAADSLGMEVYGYDPYISIEFALKLSRSIRIAAQLAELLENCDYISIHVPLQDSTRDFIGAAQIQRMKDGIVLLNFSRDLLMDEAAVGAALGSGKVRRYVTDFANEHVVSFPNTIILPHLGAATEEAEENCAEMAVRQAQDYLDNGNIVNSVNFPAISLGRAQFPTRVVVLHDNVPGILSKITTLFGENDINIEQMVSASRGSASCAIFDVAVKVPREFAMGLSSRPGILKVRVIHKNGD